MVDAIILAGGYSSRAQANKMTFEYQGKPLIMHAIEAALAVCDRVIVVTGHYHAELKSILDDIERVNVIYNENYPQGMFTSIKKGVAQTSQDFFILPGDYPNIKIDTYHEILKSTGRVRVPSFNHRLGHPIFFEQKLKTDILETDFENLKDFRNSQEYTIIDVDDPGIINDIDDWNDYMKLLRKD